MAALPALERTWQTMWCVPWAPEMASTLSASGFPRRRCLVPRVGLGPPLPGTMRRPEAGVRRLEEGGHEEQSQAMHDRRGQRPAAAVKG